MKRDNGKRLISLLLALVLAVGMVSFSTMEAEASYVVSRGTCGDNLTWKMDSEGVLTISGKGEMYNYGYGFAGTVPWSKYCDVIKKVEVQYGVTSIGHMAFNYCPALTKVTLPRTLTSIGDSAFKACDLLTEVVIPDSVTSIGTWAFYGCAGLEKVVLPDGLESLGSGAFNFCPALKELVIPGSLEKVGLLVTYCHALEKITILDGVTEIGERAFSYCSALKEVVIPNSVTSIGGAAFEGCSPDIEIVLSEDNPHHSMVDGLLINTDRMELVFCPAGKTGRVVIPDGITGIVGSAFAGCSALTEIVIPDSVTSIGAWAFSGCSSLTELGIPSVATDIGEAAFAGCSSLRELTLPNGLTSIGYEMLSGCSSLTEITIPNSVTSIGDAAFWECSSLTEIVIPVGVSKVGYGAFNLCTSLTEVVVLGSNTKLEWLFGESYMPPEGLVLCGDGGSRAEAFAREHGMKFVALNYGANPTVVSALSERKYEKGSDGQVKIYCTGARRNLIDVEMDGVVVDKSNYTLKDGSTIVIFKQNYLDTLSAGSHTVTLNYKGVGSADAVLEIVGAAVVYGDASGDNKISTVDLAMLRRCLANMDPVTGESSVTVQDGADANGDGEIGTLDLALLRRYLANTDPVTGESPIVLGPRAS